MTSTIKQMVKSRDFTTTTSSTGAVSIPSELQDKLVGWASTDGSPRNIFRRDINYLVVRDFYNPSTAVANTQITIRLYYV